MLKWVSDIFALYLMTVPAGIVLILFLDSFKVHIKALVVNAIQDLGV